MKKIILDNIKTFRGSFSSIFICIATIGIIRQVFPLLFGYMLDDVVQSRNYKVLITIALFYTCLFLCAQVLHFIENITYANLFNRMLLNIRKKCLTYYLKTTRDIADKKQFGDIITTINSDIDKFLEFINNCVINLATMSLELVVILIFMTLINPIICIYIILGVSVSIFTSRNTGKLVENLYVMQRSQKSIVISFVLDTLEGKREIKLLNAFDFISNKIKEEKLKQLHIEYKISQRNLVIEKANAFVCLLVNLGLMILSSYLIFKNKMTVGNYVSCLIYFETVLAMMGFYGYLSHAIPEAKASINRVLELMNLPCETCGEANDVIIDKIELRNMSFQYNEDVKVLKNINLSINKGEMVAFTGGSGSGKTTLLKNLVGFYDNYEGEIILGSHELKKINKNYLRSKISVMFQNGYLFNGLTIRENLCMGMDIPDKQIKNVCEKVNILEYVEQLSSGFDTVWNKNLCGISGGQKQRLLLVRALLKNADVYILDEATASLDAENEMIIGEAVKEILKDKISIIISHREQLIGMADRVYSLVD